eukprot:scaffold192602_cov17-Tisochrysis_lutea.AAC.1
MSHLFMIVLLTSDTHWPVKQMCAKTKCARSGPGAVEVAWALACLQPSGASAPATNAASSATKHATT